MNAGPHQGQQVRTAGRPIRTAQAAMLMVHGRGARAEDILSLAETLAQSDYAYVAPQATNNTWYPNRFLAPIDSNEPYLSSALDSIQEAFDQITQAGIQPERTILLGFSQGACLTLEFAARHARRYGGVIGLSGGLIGPADTPRDYAGSLAGTPIFLGCSDIDIHIPKERVLLSGAVFRQMGARVTERLYPGLDHSINEDEIDFIKSLMQNLVLSNRTRI